MSPRPIASPKQAWILTALILLITFILLYSFTTTRSTLWDRDEPRFSRATVEMVNTGNYLVPHFNGKLRPDKPILIYWLMSIPVRIFGPTEFACRFFAPLAVLGTAILLPFIGGSLGHRRAGIFAMAILPAAPLMIVSGTAATTDAVLIFFIVLSLWLFLKLEAANNQAKRLRWMVLLGISLGAAVLTKGPVGLAIPMFCFLGTIVLDQKNSFKKQRILYIGGATILAIGLFLAWAIPANLASGGELARIGLGRHVVGRSLKAMEGHGGHALLWLPFYIPISVVGFFPWTLFFPAGWRALKKASSPGNPSKRFLLSWILPTFILMSLVATKLPHYILPIWPAFALMAGIGLEKELSHEKAEKLTANWDRWLILPLGILLAIAFFIASFLSPLDGTSLPLIFVGLIFAGMTVWATLCFQKQMLLKAATILWCGMALFLATASYAVLPKMEKTKISKPIAELVNQNNFSKTPVSVFGYREPSLVFYLNREESTYLSQDQEVSAWDQQSTPGILIIRSKFLEKFRSKGGLTNTQFLGEVSGINIAKEGRPIKVTVLGRHLPNPPESPKK
ncbi:MAG: glycosyltransferase family 39 protein [Deltaproteobacteria bacterium]|nr:glycosyltransferase family 39 protein [Deltaproteobacteria bacterium]